ncbi:MAG: HNH endonuclease [bacterium]
MYNLNEQVSNLIIKLESILEKKYQKRENEYLGNHQDNYIFFSKYFIELFKYLNNSLKGQVRWRVVSNAINFNIDISHNLFLTTDFKSNNILKVGFYKENIKNSISEIKNELPDKYVRKAGDGGDWFYIDIDNLEDLKYIIKKYALNSYINKLEHLQNNSKKYDYIDIKKLIFTKKLIEERDKVDEFEQSIRKLKKINKKEGEQLVKTRIGQGIFKNALLKKYGKCQICGLSNKNFLIASHIKPWSKSLGYEKLDVNNGFLLCPSHDALFDKGFITFDMNGEIILSNQLDQRTKLLMNINEEIKIKLNDKQNKYIKWHRLNHFIK